MCEVTIDNFSHVINEIKDSFNKANFIAIDTEFSALNITEKLQNSLFDSPSERYNKLRILCEQIIPMQIGISTFIFEPDRNSYTSNMYTFYVFPKKFLSINPSFLCQSSSLHFLCSYKFDFNKFAYKGLPYINRIQEKELQILQTELDIESVDIDDLSFDHLLQEESRKISKWLHNNESSDLILSGIFQKYSHNLDILYFFHKHIRKRFDKQIWTIEENGEIVIKKVSRDEFNILEKNHNLETETLNKLLGFTHIFRFLIDSKKPIIGHNLLTDLMIMYHRFENPLPKSYKKFKTDINNLFPIIYDTKTLTFELKQLLPDNKIWERNALDVLYTYFKDGHGRHLAPDSPLIQVNDQPSSDQFHNAGWDSYCTGYIFIRMAHIYATHKFTSKSKFMSSELYAAVNHLKNCINVIRCSVSHISLDSKDPVSKRPPCLIVESVKGVPLDLLKISCLLSSYGFVEIKPYSHGGRRAVVAVDNFGSARRILRQYKTHDEFQIKQYSIIKHSPVARTAIWSGVFASGIILAWLAHSIWKS